MVFRLSNGNPSFGVSFEGEIEGFGYTSKLHEFPAKRCFEGLHIPLEFTYEFAKMGSMNNAGDDFNAGYTIQISTNVLGVTGIILVPKFL